MPDRRVRWWAVLAGLMPLLLLVVPTPLADYGVYGARPAYAAAVAGTMVLWWLLEAMPIGLAALLPVVLFPLLGVFGPDRGANVAATVGAYLDPYIFLFAGGMAIGAAMQQWNLHRRIALAVMAHVGTRPARLLLGVLVATAFISLWISNTATAAMMMPIGMALMAQLEREHGGRRLAAYGMAVMLAIAYGANVGGIGTKIGTAPNGQLAGFLEQRGVEVSFVQFLAVGLPFVVLFLPLVWLALWRLGRQDGLRGDLAADRIAAERAALGPLRGGERIVLFVFAATAALWIAGKPLTGLARTLLDRPGLGSAEVEGTIAVAAAVALLLWRHRGVAVLALRSLRTVPWETLLLLGGGFAMAAGIQGSGLSDWMGAQLGVVRELPPFAQVLVAALATVALSAVASNTATIAIALVVLADATTPDHMPTLLFAAAFAASCDFALPVGTPPNAIVFGSGYVSVPRMARTGIVLDLAAALVAAAWCWLVVPHVVGH